MSNTINIHLDGVGRSVATMVGILMEPYGDFVNALHAAGRITDEERETVRRALQDRMDRLPDLVAERLHARRSEDLA